MFKVVLIGVLSFFLLGCGEPTSLTKIPKDIEYYVLTDVKNNDIKRSIEVKLNKKVNRNVLETIATTLKEDDGRTYQRTFIGYYLNDEGTNQGYWATTHFNPDLKVRIIGLSIEEENSLTKNSENDQNRDVIGIWIDTRSGVGSKMVMFYVDNKLFLENSYSDGSSGVTELKESLIHGDKKIEEKEDNSFGEFYLINKNGSLEFWSENGHYFTAKKIG